jgi:eukaryotic-like serine/threonine-protein kinase
MQASREVLESGVPLRRGDPTVLAEYTMLRRLGEGGMGAVYLARGPGQRLVAIKVIRSEYAQNEEFRARFRQETDNARRVARFCTAEVLDADPDADQPYLVTEFVEGDTLSQVVAGGKLSAANIERLAVGIAAALTAIHGAGIVHRDLKPGNVMLSPYGPRVIDFGIARAADAAVGLTVGTIGTLPFMAPEQLLGDPVTPAVDIFAWGAVVAYASSGRYPFPGDSNAMNYRIVHTQPDLSGLDEIGPLRSIVERAMNKNPSARPSATDLLLALLSNTSGTPTDDAENAVTEALTGWGPGPGTQVTVKTPWYYDGGGPRSAEAEHETAQDTARVTAQDTESESEAVTELGAVSRASAGTAVEQPTAVKQPTAVEQLDATDQIPAASGRQASGPPSRPREPSDPGGRDGQQRSRRRLVAGIVAAVAVVAVAIFGGIKLGSHSKSGTQAAGSTVTASPKPTATGNPTTTASAGAGTPIPRSAQPLSAATIVYTRVGEASLYAIDSDGSNDHRLGTGTGAAKTLPAVSPDRRTIAYLTAKPPTLWLMAADGTGSRPVLQGAAASKLKADNAGDRTAWSPDGQSVAFYAKGPSGVGLYVVQVGTGTYHILPTGLTRLGQPSWSPSGAQIGYWATSSPTATNGALYAIAADGKSGPRQVISGANSEPVWSPDSSHLAFQRDSDTGSAAIWTVAADGSQETNLTGGSAGSGTDQNPSYSPTGQLVFRRGAAGETRLYLADPAKPGVVTLIPGQTGAATNPSWSQAPAS